MDRVWITNGSTSVAPIVNPLNAACHAGFVPSDVYLLTNPTIEDVTDRAAPMIETITEESGGETPRVTIESIEDELAWDAIVAFLRDAIEAGRGADAEVAVDVTPGRKFWSIISFRAGQKYGADHLFYSHVHSEAYYGTAYPTIPRTAMGLVDFTEVL